VNDPARRLRRWLDFRCGHFGRRGQPRRTFAVADLVYVVVTVALFATLALVVRAVERL
jgi:hypothetical protein